MFLILTLTFGFCMQYTFVNNGIHASQATITIITTQIILFYLSIIELTIKNYLYYFYLSSIKRTIKNYF